MTDQEFKQKALGWLETSYARHGRLLPEIDQRLDDYYVHLLNHSGFSPGDEDVHNVNEILGALKLLRQLSTYPVNIDKVKQVIRLREGQWQRDERGIWHHVSGGLKNPGTQGDAYYRWQPFQVFIWTAMYGPQCWIDTGVTISDREPLPTEKIENGHLIDLRRLCTDFTYYAPRKTDKTGLSAYNNFLFFMLEDHDCEIYCTANSQQQASLLFKRTQALIRQMDPSERRIRFTSSQTNWRTGQPRQAQMWALSAGGKTKDGLFAQLCCADEFGSAAYVGNKSDMGSLVNVVLSSMGPRREPMLFTSTTAGTIQAGPFIDKLAAMKQELRKEVDYCEGTATPTLEGDRWMCILFEPDAWEMYEEVLFTSKTVRRKVNPMLGITVQHSFYDQAIADSRLDPLKKLETVTKLFNVYQTGTTKDWFKPEEIRRIQIPMRVDDCKAEDGWIVYCGMDFSRGDDLNGDAFLCYNVDTGEFFGDMDVYMSEDAANESPIRELLYKWAADGWLTIVPGKTFDPSWPVSRIIQLDSIGVNFGGFGYDPMNAKIVVNAISQWVFDIGLDPKQLVVPVRQNFASYNPAVNEFDYLVKRSVDDGEGHQVPAPLVHLSMNPLWPYCFGCVMLQESNDGMRNFKPVKRSEGAACKVDPVQMLLSGLILHDQQETRINK